MKILQTRNDLLKILPKECVVAELGVFLGNFSEDILRICKPNLLYLVDLFEGNICSGDKDGNNIVYTDMNYSFINLTKKYGNDPTIKIIKNYTYLFLESIPDFYLDVVYIDADHSYESVKKDLELSLIKVKKGGYILGHDYNLNMFPGVVAAADEFCVKNNLKISYLTKDGCPTYGIINE